MLSLIGVPGGYPLRKILSRALTAVKKNFRGGPDPPGYVPANMLSRSRQNRDIEISRLNLNLKYFKHKEFLKQILDLNVY